MTGLSWRDCHGGIVVAGLSWRDCRGGIVVAGLSWWDCRGRIVVVAWYGTEVVSGWLPPGPCCAIYQFTYILSFVIGI